MSEGNSGSGGDKSQGSNNSSQSQSNARAAYDAARTPSQSRSDGSQNQNDARRGITSAYVNADNLPGGRAGFEDKAPNMWKDFDKAQADKNNPAFKRWEQQRQQNQQRDDRIHTTPVSKAEREAREKLRAKPKLEHTMEIDGSIKRSIDERAHSENERRMHFIKKRMQRVDGKARTHFDRSR